MLSFFFSHPIELLLGLSSFFFSLFELELHRFGVTSNFFSCQTPDSAVFLIRVLVASGTFSEPFPWSDPFGPFGYSDLSGQG